MTVTECAGRPEDSQCGRRSSLSGSEFNNQTERVWYRTGDVSRLRFLLNSFNPFPMSVP